MLVEFEDDDLRQLYEEADFKPPGFGAELIRAFRKVVGLVYAATDERDLRALRSLRFEKLQGQRLNQYSMRLHRGSRLIFRLETPQEGKIVVIVEIVDYH
jgi:proteic killer suppression protein